MSSVTAALLESGAAPARRAQKAVDADAALFGGRGQFYRLRPSTPEESRAAGFPSRYALVIQAQPGQFFPRPLPWADGDELDRAILATANEPSDCVREVAFGALLDLLAKPHRPTAEAWRDLTRARLGWNEEADSL